ncbi:MAG TPA: glycosyltransferase family 9 protein, partial [Gemmataceae bacterium]
MPDPDRDAWAAADNVLAVRLDALGDVLMTEPAVRALTEARPGRRVTLLTSPAGAAVAPLLPAVDEVIVYDAPWMKATTPRADARPECAMIDRIRRGRFDAAAIFTVYSQSPLPAALLCHLAGIPRRLAHCRENPYQLLTDWVPEPEPALSRHEVRRQLDLAAAVGGRTADERLRLCVPPEATARAREALGWFGLEPGDRWAAVHVGASAPSRRYPPDLFAGAVRLMVREHGIAVVFTGGPAEVELVEQVRSRSGVFTHSLAGELDVAGLAAVLALAPVLVANNTGPVHVAAAVGTPVVDLYALTNPQHTPWMVPCRVLNHDVPCRNCYKSVCPEGHQHCLALVPPAAVARAAAELIGETASDRSGGRGS